MDFGYIFVFCRVDKENKGKDIGENKRRIRGRCHGIAVDAFVFFLVETLCVRRDIINQNVHYVRLLKV